MLLSAKLVQQWDCLILNIIKYFPVVLFYKGRIVLAVGLVGPDKVIIPVTYYFSYYTVYLFLRYVRMKMLVGKTFRYKFAADLMDAFFQFSAICHRFIFYFSKNRKFIAHLISCWLY